MATTAKIIAIGNSAGIILPKETLARLNVEKGDTVFITESSQGIRLDALTIEEFCHSNGSCARGDARKSGCAQETGGMSEPVWIRQDVVLSDARGGFDAPRRPGRCSRPGLLESALARPKNLFAYSEQTPSLAGLLPPMRKGSSANHPFVDGNKRTAFIVSFTF